MHNIVIYTCDKSDRTIKFQNINRYPVAILLAEKWQVEFFNLKWRIELDTWIEKSRRSIVSKNERLRLQSVVNSFFFLSFFSKDSGYVVERKIRHNENAEANRVKRERPRRVHGAGSFIQWFRQRRRSLRN